MPYTGPDEQKIREIAKGLRESVTSLCAQAIASREGFEQVMRKIGPFTIEICAPWDNSRSAIMRGIAGRVIPDEFSWQVLECHGGDPELVITGYTAFYPL